MSNNSLAYCFVILAVSYLKLVSSQFIHLEIQRQGQSKLFEKLFQQDETIIINSAEKEKIKIMEHNTPKKHSAVSYKRSHLLDNLRINRFSSNPSPQQEEKQTHPPPDHGNFTDFSLFTSFGNAYMVDMYIGSENTEFKVMLDTGSSYTWVTDKNCTSCDNLGIHKHYNCDKSTTCANQTQEAHVIYGKGIVRATVFRDQLGFNHDTLVAKNQDFLLVTSIEDLSYFPGQGLLGLGFDSLSDGRSTIFDNLKQQGSIQKRQFAFSLSGDADELEYGQTNKDFFIVGGDGVDPHLADEMDSFTCDVSYKPYWSLNVTSIIPIISDVEMNIGLQTEIAIIDSGTSFIVFNEQDFEVLKKFLSKLSKLQCEIDERYHLFKCMETKKDVYPIFKFTLCSHSRPILVYPQQYLICDITACYIRIMSISFGLFAKRIVILGDIFLRTQYILFNQDDMNISFYQKKTSGNSANPQQSINTNRIQGNLTEEIQDVYQYLEKLKSSQIIP